MDTITIGIIGAGYSGTAFAATLKRLYPNTSFKIILFDKSNQFGLGHAYSTPYDHHLLNVRAKDMSAFEDEPLDFIKWLNSNDNQIGEKFISRKLYGEYLKAILDNIEVQLARVEVIDIQCNEKNVTLVLQDHMEIKVDKVVLAIGNNEPSHFSFPVSPSVNMINNPWDYVAIEKIPAHAPVLIVGTGLSMIDAVLSLHAQNHKGKIIALSRHGLLPLPHRHQATRYVLKANDLPNELILLTKKLREKANHHVNNQGDWRDIISALRYEVPQMWQNLTLQDKKQFLRHVMSYWNVHRHRVHDEIDSLLQSLQEQGQLEIIAGRVIEVSDHSVEIKPRHQHVTVHYAIDWLINCMGPTLTMRPERQPLIKSLMNKNYAVLDDLKLGFVTNKFGALKNRAGDYSTMLFTIGPPRKGESWECTAVPDIRKQIKDLAKVILQKE